MSSGLPRGLLNPFTATAHNAAKNAAANVQRDLPPLFTDNQGGFMFATHLWKNMWVADRERYKSDALAHCDEALRRQAVCRMADRSTEADHWHAIAMFLQNRFKLLPAKEPE